MPKQIQGSQTDFSFGEIDVALKRADQHPARKAGLRQMANARILNSGAIQDRPGRRALFPISNGCTRVDELTISPGNIFKIAFGTNRLQIIDSTGTVVANFSTRADGVTPFAWATATLHSIVYTILDLSIYITFPGQIPQVLTWDGVLTWTLADYAEQLIGNQKRTTFFRISPQGVFMFVSNSHGTITVGLSAPLFVPAQVGTRVRFVGRQILLTGFTNATTMTGSVEETLLPAQVLTVSPVPSTQFNVGDEVIGTSTGARGQIWSIVDPNIQVQLLNAVGTTTGGFTTSDIVVGPSGAAQVSAAAAATAPSQTLDWDEEVMNAFRGYPASCFVDQFRLGFCNFPAVPGGICWSAINNPIDLDANDASSPDNAIFEVAPNKVQVFHVTPGPESSEFVFCDRAVYYIPISPTNPLKPGSVAFQLLSGDGSANVQPRISQEAILYANAGQNSIMAVIATGAFLRPFNTKNLTQFHTHLFNNIVTIAVPNADGTFNERYAYVLNGDGSIAVGKYNPESLQTNLPVIGWGPWSGGAAVSWIAAWAADVLFTSSYFGVPICEVLDDTQYLDSALLVNALPTPFTPPGGKGPLWFIPSQTVSLMDQVTRVMGTYQIDANGFIIPQNNGGENLAIASLVAGQPWTMIAEPFAPDAQPGADMHQRMELRQFSKFAVYVINSTGFLFGSLFSAKQTPTSPAPGTIMSSRRVTAWNQGDDATKPPTLRETAESWTPPGSSYDPRAAIIKDVPGPLQILEFAMEISI